MTDLLLQIGASKFAVSVALACVAWVVQRRGGPSLLSWALWLLLLAALLTPPLVPFPVLSPGVEPPASVVFSVSPQAPATPTLAVSVAERLSLRWKEGLAFLWLSGVAVVAAWSLIRTLRFHRHLEEGSTVAPAEVQLIADELAETLGLASVPTIHFTKAHVAPLVWWFGGTPRVVFPSMLWSELERLEVRYILAHELAHVRRRDHLVRWIEWLACTVFWWNPLAWWARRRLRAAEEFCCDALVSASLSSEPQVYARSLLRTIELMSTTPAIRPPTLASTADGGQRVTLLEERLRMIVRNESTPPRRWLHGAARVVTPLLLVASLAYCTNREGPTLADAARTSVERDAAEDHTGVREILSTWLDRLTLADDLDMVGSELDSINSTVMATDIDGDGNVDLVVGRMGARALLDVYRNDGLGRFVRH